MTKMIMMITIMVMMVIIISGPSPLKRPFFAAFLNNGCDNNYDDDDKIKFRDLIRFFHNPLRCLVCDCGKPGDYAEYLFDG